MLFAQTIVKQRTGVEELTYAVPAQIVPYLKMGSLVTVPLRRRQVRAIVVGLRKTVSKELRPKIKSIVSIERTQGLSDAQIRVIRRLAIYYAASLAEVAFHALGGQATLGLSRPAQAVGKPVFLQADWEDRTSEYVKLIAKHPRKSFLLLFAQASYAEAFAVLARKLRLEVVFDDGKAATRKTLESLQAASTPFVLIATIQKAFYPLSPGDVIVIDQPNHVGAKQQQRPFMRTQTIGRVRAQEEALQLIVGDSLPGVTDVLRFVRDQWQLKSRPYQVKPLTIFNRKGSRSLLVEGLQREIADRLQKKERLLILVMARGWAPALVCTECGHIFECQQCGRTTSLERGELVCRYCHHRDPRPTQCSVCGSELLHEVGEGVTKVVAELRQSFPGVSVQEVSGDQPHYRPSTQLTVATEKIFSWPALSVDTAIFLSVDRLLTAAQLNNTSELLAYLLYFQRRARTVLVQTYFPDHYIWGIAGQTRIKEFFQRELSLRKRYHLPPYSQLFSVVGQVHSVEALHRQLPQLIDTVLAHLKDAQIGEVQIEPVANQQRARFSVLTSQLTDKQKLTLRDALPPAWHLDIEP